jgi:hypothetical protein
MAAIIAAGELCAAAEGYGHHHSCEEDAFAHVRDGSHILISPGQVYRLRCAMPVDSR